MDERNPKHADEPIFRALLTPYRSLGQRGFFRLMAFITTLWLGVGAFFLARGAWPVFGFFGLDVMAVYIAFRLSYRSARAREEVIVSRTTLLIRKIAPSGRARQHLFNPLWTKFNVRRRDETGITAMAMTSHGETVPIGDFLNPDDRESFAISFARALATARR